MIPSGSTAVMARRHEAPDSLDLFCTPPWATRALVDRVLRPRLLVRPWQSAWDPACGFGHLSGVLEETFAPVVATDIFAHGGVRETWPPGWSREQDFLDERAETPVVDWIITNPPFRLAEAFALRALSLAQVGVALLVRTAWIEGEARWRRLFQPHPPAVVAQFVERVPMVRGCWRPDASSATAYAWVVWDRRAAAGFVPARGPELAWIPPGCARALTRHDDARRYGAAGDAPLIALLAAE